MDDEILLSLLPDAAGWDQLPSPFGVALSDGELLVLASLRPYQDGSWLALRLSRRDGDSPSVEDREHVRALFVPSSARSRTHATTAPGVCTLHAPLQVRAA
ncbi:MAG: hypothetical protein AAGE52_29275 [Myxococcota bacterium]